MVSLNPQTNVITRSIRYQIAGSKPSTTWTVTRDPVDGAMTCDCPDATYRGRQCKHQRAVIAGAAGKPIVRCSVRPSRGPALDYSDIVIEEGADEALLEAAEAEAREALTDAEIEAYRDSLTMLLDV